MKYELQSMLDKNVWHIINKCDIPSGTTIIEMKWVYKQKIDNRY